MPSTMAHEHDRWRSMTEQQLVTRLTRIRDPQKFNNFLEVARESNHARLYTQCLMKMQEHGVRVQGTIDGYLIDDQFEGYTLEGLSITPIRGVREESDRVESDSLATVGVRGGRAGTTLRENMQGASILPITPTESSDRESVFLGLDPAMSRSDQSVETVVVVKEEDKQIVQDIKSGRVIRIKGDKKKEKLINKGSIMKDFRNEFNIEAPRAKGAYLEDAPDIIWTEHGWVLEDKEDAMRCTMQIGSDRSLLVGRNRKDFLKGVKKAGAFMSLDHKNPLLAFGVFSKEFEGTMLDGELTETFKGATKKTIAKGKGIDTALGLMEYDKYTTERLSIGDKLGYGVWDCLFYKGVDIRDRDLWKRRKAAAHVIEQLGNSKIWLLKQSLATDENMQVIFSRGKEGAIAKNIYHSIPLNQKVHPGYWKLKGDDKRTVDGFITGVQEAYGGGSGVKGIKPIKTDKAASFTICMLNKKQESVEICKMKGNLTDDMIEYGKKEFYRFENKVVEMKVSGWDGARFRWPRFHRWRDDKTQGDCVISEQIGRIKKK